MKKWLVWLSFAMLFILCPAVWAAPAVPPAPTSSIYVQDYAGVMSAESKRQINAFGSQLAAKTKAQIVIVTVKSLDAVPIEDYALAVLRTWGIGDQRLNNGVLLVAAIDDRQSRIEVGYGLEGALPDAKTGRIQDQYMLPYFQQGDYDKGILNAYLALADVVAGEYGLALNTGAQKAVRQQTSAEPSWWDALPGWLQLVMIGAVILLLIADWLFFGGAITWLLLSLLRSGRGGGGGSGGGGGYGGGSGGGGGSSRRW